MSAVIEQIEILVDEWVGCYRGGWKGVIVDGAFAHPAKVAFNLAKRIYEHAIDEGWIQPKDVVIDPFGGIGGCAFHGLMNGMIVVTNELEEKFVNLSKENRELWRKQYTGLPGFNADNWIILQGDSRKLASVIREAGIAVSSPPYATELMHGRPSGMTKEIFVGRQASTGLGDYGESQGQLGAMKEGDLILAVSSPPYARSLMPDMNDPEKYAASEARYKENHPEHKRPKGAAMVYGNTPGNLGHIPEGTVEGAMAISSPPFPQPYTGGGGINQKGYVGSSGERDDIGWRTYQSKGGDRAEGNLETLKDGGFDVAISSPPYVSGGHHPDQTGAWGGQAQANTKDQAGYGRKDGQMGQMKDEGFQAAISSPPYENAVSSERNGIDWDSARLQKRDNDPYVSEPMRYGVSDHNLGNQRGDTFWSASRTILEQLYSVLTPGAHAIFIVKSFVRNKQIVDFPGQWAQLCEAVGFKLIHDHHALLTEKKSRQPIMEEIAPQGETWRITVPDKDYSVKRVSFFRRLHEKRAPETEIYYENVLCFERP